jgi:hypothetical protein
VQPSGVRGSLPARWRRRESFDVASSHRGGFALGNGTTSVLFGHYGGAKAVMVVGATSGIGRAVSLRVAAWLWERLAHAAGRTEVNAHRISRVPGGTPEPRQPDGL